MDIDPIPYYYEPIDRNAILVRPKKPFYDWLNKVFNEERHISDKDENNIYLIREMGSNEDIKKWIKKNFDNLFANELNDWYTDESGWPTNRTYKMFRDWFDVEVHSMVLDLEEFPVTKD
jgi:hypothetical protein